MALHIVDLSFADEPLGTIAYNDESKTITVTGDNEGGHLTRVRTYMSRERTFTIPTANPKDQDDGELREDKAKPSESLMYFELALCELHAKTGVWVDWESERKETEKVVD